MAPGEVVALASAEQAPLIGQTLGKQYRVESVLGRGANGLVYRAIRLSDELPVAVKTIATESADNVRWIRRFRREARLLARLDHPHSVRMYDYGHTGDGLAYLVMELLEGRELRDELDAVVRLPLGNAVRIASQVFSALFDAHSRGVVHRDLKPSNIFLCKNDKGDIDARVIDYGLARDESSGAMESLTGSGVIVGTPAYMPPEQIHGEAVGPPADLYAMGAILFEMISGRPPFTGKRPMDLLTAHLRLPVPSIIALRPDLSCGKALQQLIEVLMNKDPTRRPGNAAQAATLVEALLRDASMAPEASDNTAIGVSAVDDDGDSETWRTGSEQEMMKLEVVHQPSPATLRAATGTGHAVMEATGTAVRAAVLAESLDSVEPTAIGVPAVAMVRPVRVTVTTPTPDKVGDITQPERARRKPTPKPRTRAQTPKPRPAPRPASGARRLPRRAVPMVDKRINLEFEFVLMGSVSDEAQVVLMVLFGKGRPPQMVSMQRDGGTWKGRLSLARPTAKDLRVRCRVASAAGLGWRLQVWSSQPKRHKVGDEMGATTGKSDHFDATLTA